MAYKRRASKNDKKTLIPYGRQTIGRDDINEVARVLRSDWLTQGPEITRFENDLARYCGTKYAIAFSSGTAALQGAFFALGFKKDDEFITTPLTFVATVNAGLWQGLRPVFSDIELSTGNINPEYIEKEITSRTKAIVAVDYAGMPVDHDRLRKIARDNDLFFIEDAAHALGAAYKGKKIGSIADMTMFSFHPIKSITTGEGGAVTTNNKEWYDRLLMFRNHGQVGKNRMEELGLNYRMTDMQAALGVSQLKKLDYFIKTRRAIALRYQKAFAIIPELILPYALKGTESGWHLYVIRLKPPFSQKRDLIVDYLRDRGIGVQIHYFPVHLQPYYQKLGYSKNLCPSAKAFYDAAISLPIFPKLSRRAQEFVIKEVKNAISSILL